MNERSGTLELEQISVVFRNKKQTIDAVRNVNITIPTGTVFGLIGYSGAGKSGTVPCQVYTLNNKS